MKNWLMNLKKGDQVILVETWGKPRYYISHVTSNMGTFVTVSHVENKFNTKDGYLLNDGAIYHAHLMQATSERLKGLLEQRVRNRAIEGIRRANFDALETHTLVLISRAIYNVEK